MLTFTSLFKFLNTSCVFTNCINKFDRRLSKTQRHAMEKICPSNFNSTVVIITIDIGSNIFVTLFIV